MAFTLVQSATGSVGSSNATSVTVTSSATAIHHLLVAFVMVQGASVVITPPAGWAQIDTTQGINGGSGSAAMFYLQDSTSGVTSHVFSFSASCNGAVAFEEWSGALTSGALDREVANQHAKSSTSTTGTTAVLANSGELAIWGLGVYGGNVLTYSSVTNGYVEDTLATVASTKTTSKAQATLFYNTSVGSAATSSGATMSSTGGAGNTTILAVFKPTGTDNPYGVTIGMHPGVGNAGPTYAYWTNLFADMHAKGMTWLRFQLSWYSIEFPQGTYTWTVLDDAVQQCNANNINILYTFQNVPAWALTTSTQQANTEPFYLPDPTLMAAWATQVVTRYDGKHGHGYINAYGYNEDFSIHFTDIVSTLTLNQTVNPAGAPYTSFTINAAGFTPQIGTKLYFNGYGSADVATVSANVALNDTTVTVSSFTPNATYTAGTTINIGWVGLYNNTLYPGLYGSGGAVTPSNKSQPARDFHFASPVVAAVTAAVRAANPAAKIGMPVIWWPMPINNGVPNTPVSNYTASLQTLYNDLGTGFFDFLDFHYYSNTAAPLVGSSGVSTITQAMTDLRTVASANGDPTIPIDVTEFGWQVPTDVPDAVTQATYYGQVLDAVRAGGTNPNGKIFFYTLDYSPSTTSQSTLVKWNGAAYVYQPAWTTWGNYITQYPQWNTIPITMAGAGTLAGTLSLSAVQLSPVITPGVGKLTAILNGVTLSVTCAGASTFTGTPALLLPSKGYRVVIGGLIIQ